MFALVAQGRDLDLPKATSTLKGNPSEWMRLVEAVCSVRETGSHQEKANAAAPLLNLHIRPSRSWSRTLRLPERESGNVVGVQ